MGAPPVVEYLTQTYGLQGMFLIFAALEFHSVAAGLMMRPLTRYTQVISNDESSCESDELDIDLVHETEDEVNTCSEETDATAMLLVDEMGQTEFRHDEIKEQQHWDSACNFDEDREFNDPPSLKNRYDANRKEEHTSITPTQPLSEAEKGCLKCSDKRDNGLSDGAFRGNYGISQPRIRERSISFRDETYNVYEDTTEPNTKDLKIHRFLILTSQHSVDSKMTRHRNGTDIQSRSNRELNNVTSHQSSLASPQHARRGLSKHSLFNRELSHPGSTSSHVLRSSTWSIANPPLSEMIVDTEVIALENKERRMSLSRHSGLNRVGRQNHRSESDKDTHSEDETRYSCWAKIQTAFTNILSRDLFRTTSMRVLMISTATGALVQYLYTYLPSLATKEGMSASQVSVLLTVGGAVDLASRVAIGLFTDLHILTPGQICAIAQVILGTVFHFGKFFTNYNELMFLSVLNGLFGGTRQILGTLITIEFMGLDRFRRALGFQAMLSTLSLAVHHPLLSATLEATGSFAFPLHYVGAALYLSSILLLMAPLANRLDAQRELTTEL